MKAVKSKAVGDQREKKELRADIEYVAVERSGLIMTCKSHEQLIADCVR
jgi:hypothetical protein